MSETPLELTPQSVQEIYAESITDFWPNRIVFPDGLQYFNDPDRIGVSGILNTFIFSARHLFEHFDDVRTLLHQLPPEFLDRSFENGGGGWSFLQACTRRDGQLWTGEHATMEKLMCLGLALNLVRYLAARDLWQTFPGEMPYFLVVDPPETLDDYKAWLTHIFYMRWAGSKVPSATLDTFIDRMAETLHTQDQMMEAVVRDFTISTVPPEEMASFFRKLGFDMPRDGSETEEEFVNRCKRQALHYVRRPTVL